MRVSSELAKLGHTTQQSALHDSLTVEKSKEVSGRSFWFLSSTICALGAIFYCYEYYLRVAPSVMVTGISEAYGIEAVAFGNLVACYYYAYTPMQLPVGMLMDKYGARRILTLACLCCALGSFLFVATNLLTVAQIGRFLVGFGSAFAYVGVLTLATNWLPSKAFAMFAGLACSLGMLGAISGDITLTVLVQYIGWKKTMYYAGFAGLLLTPVIWFVIKDKPKHSKQSQPGYKKQSHSLKGLWVVMKNRQMWINGIIGSLMFLPIAAFAELWAVPFLRQAKGYSAEAAAIGVSMVFLGFAVGGPIWGWFSDRIRRRNLPLMLGALFSCGTISASIYMPNITHYGVLMALFLTGLFSSAQILVFAIGRDNNSHAITGTAMAFTNMVVMIGGAILQPMIGYFLDEAAINHPHVHMQNFLAQDYQSALGLLPICLLVASLLTFLLRETYCKQIES